MTKNIHVVDEQGTDYSVTYPKRAKGLVKNGRARYVDDHTICLACPPDFDLEDIKMDENYTAINHEDIGGEAGTAAAGHYDLAYVLRQLELITTDTGYIHNAIASLSDNSDGSMGIGLGKLVEAREQTNRRLIDLYEKMYNDLRGIKPEPPVQAKQPFETSLERIISAIEACDNDDDEKLDVLRSAMEALLETI